MVDCGSAVKSDFVRETALPVRLAKAGKFQLA